MRKIISVALLIVMLLTILTVFSSCQGNETDELILWWPSGKACREILDEALPRFKAANPGIEIKVVYKDVDSFDAYKIALNDDKTRPDVAILDHVYVQALAHDNQLANLDELGAKNIESKFPASVYSANAYNGGTYALPFSANTIVLMYNKDILKAAGVVDANGEAKPPKTMDELLDACAKVQAAGYTAFAQPNNSFSAMGFASYVARNGGELVSDDYKTVKFTTEAVVKAARNWKELSEYANPNAYEEDKFYNGKVAFVEMGSWSISKVSGSSARFDCGYTEMVSIDGSEENYSGLGLYSLCVSAKSTQKENAYKLAEFLATDKTVQMAYNQEKGLFPVTNEALADPYYAEDEAFSVYASQLQKVAPRPGTPAWPDMETAIVNMLVSIVRGEEEDIESILQQYQTQVQQATDRLYK